jgi:O-methyltransferase involved in polyketide biosynthesis
MYLTREANLATLQSISRCAMPGSELVLTYADAQLLDSQSERFLELQSRVTSMGEPFLSGFNPLEFGATLKECGLELLEDLTADKIAERYGRVGANGPVSSFSHMALARVPQRR